MDLKPSRYVSLCYSPAGAGTSIPVLVIEREHSLEVQLPPNWADGLESEDREYLSELMKDWMAADREGIPAILHELSELSIGPLRMREAGLAHGARINQLLRPETCPE